MNKLKINAGIAAILLLGSLFSGWQTLLIVAALIILFCEMNDSIKNVMIRVITFYLGLSIFNLAWDLIVQGVELIPNILNQLVELINNYLTDTIDITKLQLYLIKPILEVVSIADTVVGYLLMFVEFSFIIAVLSNKPVKENFVVKKINDFVRKTINFINGFEINQNVQPNVQQTAVNTVQMPQQATQANVQTNNFSNQ